MKKESYNKSKLVCLLIALLMIGSIAFAQNSTVEAVVVDFYGNPVTSAELFSDNNYTKTGADGKFTISMDANSILQIKAKGFESISLNFDDVSNMSQIILQAATFLYDDDKKVNLGFRQIYEGDVIGAVSQVNVSDLYKTDKTRILGQGDIGGFISPRMMGLMGGMNIRGLGIEIDVGSLSSAQAFTGQTALVVVDGMPRDLNGLRMSEIESITLLKDANAMALYGSAAINGVILITTKRGDPQGKKADFTARYGISTPMALPKYLNSADYLEYYNIARINDGQTPQYDAQTISNYRTGNKYRYPDVDYFSDEYLKPFKSYYDLNGELSGGNRFAKFYANIGWNSNGDLFNLGTGKDARENTYNVRLNVDVRANDWINIENDGRVVFYNNLLPLASTNTSETYWTLARTLRPNQYSPLLPIDLIDPNNQMLAERKFDVDGKYLLGGNSANQTGLIGNMYALGSMNRIYRLFTYNNRINVDLNQWIDGLSFHTNFSFDFISGWDEALIHQYSTYEPSWDNNDRIISMQQWGMDKRSSQKSTTGGYLRRRFGAYAALQYDRTFGGVHHLTGTILAYGSQFKRNDNYQGAKAAHAGMQVTYAYDKRYMVDFNGVAVNSIKLHPDKRVGFAPTAGLAWVMSNEKFMSSASFVDYLKLRFSGGVIKSDAPIDGYFWYDGRIGTSTTIIWNDGVTSRSTVVSNQGANPNLDFVVRKDLNVGLETVLFDKAFGFSANYFMTTNEGLVVRPSSQYPSFASPYVPYENYEDVKYQGFELGMNFTKHINDWVVFAGVNMLYSTNVKTKVNEIRPHSYLERKGRPADSHFGLEAIGIFQTVDEINSSPRQSWSSPRPGDIKYKDQNGDGVINDNDQVWLRRWTAPFATGLQISVDYKNLSLMVLGEGRLGQDNFLEGDYYRLDGQKKYSEVARKMWTAATASTATYPALSTATNTNNHQNSSFWLYSNDYFDFNRIQLTYRMPETISKSFLMNHLEWFVYVTSPFQFAKNKEIRKLSTSGAPNFRSYVIGLNISF